MSTGFLPIPRIKICGITSPADAMAAARAGADAIGVVFTDSPRQVSLSAAKAICREVRPFVSTVGVFVNASASEMIRVAAAVGLSAVQLHGEESPTLARKLKGICRIKAFRVGDSLPGQKVISAYPAEWLLFDTASGPLRGGTGKTWNWNRVKGIRWEKPWILSGGLTPDNVGAALRVLNPAAVDVSSGTESSPGKKDPRKIEAFIRSVRSANRRESRS